MAVLRGSRAPLDSLTGTDRNRVAEVMLSLADTKTNALSIPFNERMDRINRIRAAIIDGYYRVRSADIAHKLLEAMREGSGLRLRKEGGDAASVLPASVSSTDGTTDATFRPLAASESPEETNHE